jgi:hypothetical protein
MARQETHALQYQSADPVRRAVRMRWLRRGLMLAALLVGGVLFWMNYRPFAAKWEAWQRERAFNRALKAPAGDRFPEGKLMYAVPEDFQSETYVAGPALYGPRSPETARAAAELRRATDISFPGPLVFLGGLQNGHREQMLVGLAFSHCSVQPSDIPQLRHGYLPSGHYLVIAYTAISYNQARLSMGGHPGFRLAPLEALEWEYQPQHANMAPLPLSFHGSYVDPQDPSVAVILIKLAERRGRIRASIKGDDRYPSFSVEWD